MIQRVKIPNLNDGSIIEIDGHPQPLYIFHNGKLEEINPAEYNICTETIPEERWNKIVKYRCNMSYTG